MALRPVLDIALHFESFRNVDLFHQGLYHLKTRVYRKDGEERIDAMPYGFTTVPSQLEQPKPKSSRTDHHNLIPAHIQEEQFTFSTRSFLIRYCEEEVELNDIVQFRLEFDMEELQCSVPLFLEVDLMFADLTQHGGADRFGEQPDVDSTEFKSVSIQTFRIHGSDQCLHEYCPVVFDEFHFCLANLCVHTVVLDVRFRLRPPSVVASQNNDVIDEVATTVQKADVPASQNAALSLAEFVFGNINGGGREELLSLTEAFYQQHLDTLAKSYSGLVAWFREVTSKCMTEGQREAFGEAAGPPEQQLELSVLLLPRILQGDVGATNGHCSTIRQRLAAELSMNAKEDDFAMHIAHEMNKASCQILGLWYKLLNVMLYSYREISTLLRTSWEQRMSEQWRDSIVRLGVSDDVTAAPVGEPDDGVQHVSLEAEILRQSQKRTGLRPVLVEDLSVTSELQPVLYETLYSQKLKQGLLNGFQNDSLVDNLLASAPKPYRGVHLFVLVHGFQGNSFDMRLFKNNLALVYPDAIFLMSNANEDNTDGDMNEMGIRLSQEVVNFICDWCPGAALGRLSFVGYSIGGIIIRAALPLLHEYHSKLYTFLSLSALHLGFMDQQSNLFNGVIWALGYWRKITLFQQLTLKDAANLRDTYLARLTQQKGLEHFKWVVLVSSKQDNYSPVKSSGVSLCTSWENSPDKAAYTSMVRNFWEPLDPDRVLRFSVNFHITENNLDAMIGRVAHIRFIECQPIMKMLIHNYGFLFR
jgi:hypothetical protein